jgi:cytochrome c oxidase subunit 4
MKAQHGHHVTPKKTLFIVFGTLVMLTIVTGLTAQIDLGALNIPLALTIATSKAALVVLFFMALKYDNRVNALVFALGIVFAGIFLTFTLFDTVFRGDLGNVGSETISDTERREAAMREREASLPAAPAPGMTTPSADPGAADSTTAAPGDSAAAAGGEGVGEGVDEEAGE